ncbi:MAG TPA: efflux RND transporter periplasmic adaptor subunit [Candidatus Omnitrophota bacterium]|nr:efflux RND transporter periplasmic adaptor subunit [Candidatus Omnitrophota bacterium]
MSDNETNKKTEKEQNQNTQEPALFEEKTEGTSKWKTRLFLIVLVLGIAFLFWPKGYIKGEGIVQADRFARIGLTSSGILKELLHKKGDIVKKGELLVRFENPELSRKFEERKLNLEILNHDKTRLEKQVEFLAKDKDRKNILFENGVIGRLQSDKAELDYTQAAEELAMRQKEIESVEGEVKFLKERVESLELRAPFDGMLLTDPGITIGNLLKEGDFVLEFADPRSFFLEILISEKEVEKVAQGNAVKARFRAFPWKTYSGEVTSVGPRTTEEVEKVFNVKHVIPCEIKLDEFPSNVKYGMRAWIRISGKRRVIQPKLPAIQKPSREELARFINPKALDPKSQNKEKANDQPGK